MFLKILILLLFVACFACENEPVQSLGDRESYSFESDLESTVTDDDKIFFETSNSEYQLMGGEAVNTEFARSGVSCLRLDSLNKYGLNCKISNVNEREFMEVSVWVHKSSSDATLQVALTGEDSEYRYRTHSHSNDIREGEWSLHSLSFTIGPGIEAVKINVFAGGKIAYFDDFTFKHYLSTPENDLSKQLNLSIPDSSSDKLYEYITNATRFEAIPSSSKKYVSANIFEGNDTARVEMKLKGDWTDHLYTGKESYRIKIKGDFAFQGLKSFSIQHPRCRNYLDEWIIHEIADREDILTTTYDFINVGMNDVNMGVYGLEEHFDKQLLESRDRREGPILKFDETSYWTTIKRFDSFDSMAILPFFQQSTISVFKKNRTRKSDQLSAQFDEGKKLLNLFKNGYLEVEDLFDMDQLAKFYVLMELSGSGHGLRWHNRRFYFNPVTQKLEHVAYDILPFIKGANFYCQMADKLSQDQRIHEHVFDNAILYNTTFKEKYLFHLDQMTKPSYLDSIFSELDSDLKINLEAIQAEVSTYEFQKEMYYDNASYLRTWLDKLELIWDRKIEDKRQMDDWKKQQIYSERSDRLFLKDISVNAYLEKKDGFYEVFMENYHTNDIIIRGYEVKGDKDKFVILEDGILIDGFNTNADTAVFRSFVKPKKIYFTVSNSPELLVSKKIIPWKIPRGKTARMELENKFDLNSPFYRVTKNKVVFKGDLIIDKLVLIPDSYEVMVMPGTTIEFKEGGGLIATNSFFALGTAAQPIHVFCSDSSSNGITVLNGDEAILEYVTIDGLSNLDYDNWKLTGALTIYETKTEMSNCTILNNNCEDALNIIRSNFNINDLYISDTYSDGFDADFCSGVVNNSKFERTGNDCIDFSGSTVLLKDITIIASGDKGVSGGEASTLTLENISIKGAVTGVAAKDGTSIKGKEIHIYDTEYGCAAFRKKAEYAGASIELDKSEISQTGKDVLVELGSVIVLNGVNYEGKEKLDIEMLYARFE